MATIVEIKIGGVIHKLITLNSDSNCEICSLKDFCRVHENLKESPCGMFGDIERSYFEIKKYGNN